MEKLNGMSKHIETDRIIMRDILLSDAQDMFELDSDPEVHRYLGKKPVRTLDESIAMIKDIHQQYQDNGIGRWAIIDKNTKEFIGWSGLKYETGLREGFTNYDLGYRLKRKHWLQGYATESAVATLDHGFNVMKLSQITAAADVDNMGSNKILKKVGMELIETFIFHGTTCNWYELNKGDYNEI